MKDDRLLGANELFYYAWKFRDSKFLIALSEKDSIAKIIDDLRVLQTSKINFNIVCIASEKTKEIAKTLTNRGFPINYYSDFKSVNNSKDDSNPAIYAFNSENCPSIIPGIINYTLEISKKLKADRIFYLSKYSGIQIEEEIKSYLSFDEVKELIESNKDIKFPREILESFLNIGSSNEENTEFSLLKCERGSLFQEMFSHEGCGTLITDKYSIDIRPATENDIISIHSMLKPSIDAGWVLEVSEDKIANLIKQFYVYTINTKVVAAAMINDYGQAVELAKFCTIPRFQGRGGARRLANKLIKEARETKKSYVFSLSTNQAMWNLFTSLGMIETKREELPKKWLENYDLSRKSKAFKLLL